MCGRYTIIKTIEEVSHHFSLSEKSSTYQLRWNAAPCQLLPIITNETPSVLSFFQWGFVPAWAKLDFPPAINARCETVFEKNAFRFAIQYQRCLVIADGYFEWDKQGIPHYIRFPEHPLFGMAGIWEKSRCFAILTTQANKKIASIHDRMPLIVSADYYRDWLATTFPEKLLSTLIEKNQQFDFEVYTVSPKVNSPKKDSPDLIEPHRYHVQGRLF